MSPTPQINGAPVAERIGVCINYVVNGQAGHLDFVARVPGGGKPDGLIKRAQRAVSRRQRVKPSEVTITGVLTY